MACTNVLVIAGSRILNLPAYVVTGMGGAGGFVAILSPLGILWAINREHFSLSWIFHGHSPISAWPLVGWPLFGATLGACAALIYYRLLMLSCSDASETDRHSPTAG
jgi:hypothetical protein